MILMSVDLPAPFSPKERVDFTGMEIEGDAFEGTDGTEGFRDSGKLEKGVQSFYIRELRELTRIQNETE